MVFLLDTNVISEVVRPTLDMNVMTWLSHQKEEELFLSNITFAELIQGISKLEYSPKQEKLLSWVTKDLTQRFSGRILNFDLECAFLWGKWQGEAKKKGVPYSVMDLQIATISYNFKCILVTRNIGDFQNLPIKTLNPWET